MAEQERTSLDELSRFYPTLFGGTGIQDFLTNDESDEDQLAFLRKQLLDDVDKDSGKLLIGDFIKGVQDNLRSASAEQKELLHKRVRVFSDSGKLAGSEQTITRISDCLHPDDLKDGNDFPVSIILSNSHRLQPAMRNVREIALFGNAVPTRELSRAVPFVEIRIQTARSAFDQRGAFALPSLLKTLTFGGDSKFEGADRVMSNAIARGSVKTVAGDPRGSILFERGSFATGMEMFTSPQTLINPEENVNIVDRFRPLVSIESMTIEGNTLSKDEIATRFIFNLNLVVHDRSRMPEFSELFAADQFAGIFFKITYGWRHPDPPERNNAYADLINKMKHTMTTRIITVSFSMTENGQVKVALKLAPIGTDNVYDVRISSSGFENVYTQAAKLASAIERMQKEIGTDKKKFKQLSSAFVIETASKYASQPGITDDLRKAVDKFVNSTTKIRKELETQASKEAVNDLISTLEEIFGKTGDDGKPSGGHIAHVKDTIDAFIKERIGYLSKGPDPFRPSEHPLLRKDSADGTQPIKKDERTDETGSLVSLAKIFLVFFAPQLVKAAMGIDELQLMFHPFNSQAGLARDISIGSMLIPVETFRSAFQKLAYESGQIDFTLAAFVKWLIDTFVNNPDSYFYGQTDVKPGADHGDPRVRSRKKIAKEKQQPAIKTTTQERVEESNGSFKRPSVTIEMESSPRITASGSSSGGTILRMHIYDRAAGPYKGAVALLTAAVEGDLSKINSIVPSQELATSIPENKAVEIIAKAIQSKIIKIDNAGLPSLASSASSLKEFVKSNLPTLSYATEGSIITEASLQTQQSANIVNVRLEEYMKNPSTQPVGAGFDGLPLRIFPVQLETTLVGCPLIRNGQQFFIDFNTNTNADTLYQVNTFSHEISPGRFTTRVTWTWADAYGSYFNALRLVKRSIGRLKEIAHG